MGKFAKRNSKVPGSNPTMCEIFFFNDIIIKCYEYTEIFLLQVIINFINNTIILLNNIGTRKKYHSTNGKMNGITYGNINGNIYFWQNPI